ncbi:MAG TPA: ATPase, T2SS/T4P/T4SS family [Verrucomicrobiae bacterium]|nr:ATPase, T2SS/T4P/T4SS family [Verrucomicrobiae bacterium]
MDQENSAPKFVEGLITRAEQARASDIHLQMRTSGAEIAFRLDGIITPAGSIPMEVAERVFGRIKYLARLKTYQELLPQDGRIAKGEVGSKNDIRVATYPTVTGEKIVLRLFKEEQAKSLGELGLGEEIQTGMEAVLRKTSGLVLLTGPAGSGKTSTIYGCLQFLVTLGGKQIITIEDPVEQILPGVMQTEVNEARGLTFAAAARHVLRQDPEVLLIGEVRDEDTARIAARAASTGHLVITTIHAGSCKGVMDRMLLFYPESQEVLSSVELILNQRLVRKICEKCGGKGCEGCLHTGYHGRVPIAEGVIFNEALRRDFREKGSEAIKPDRTMEQAASALVEQGITNAKEVERVLGRK